MNESLTAKIVVGITISVVSAVLIAYFIPKNKTIESPVTTRTAQLTRLDHPLGVFSLEYPSSLGRAVFVGDQEEVAAYIGVNPLKAGFIETLRILNKPGLMIVHVAHKNNLEDKDPLKLLGLLHEPGEELIGVEAGFTSEKSSLIIRRTKLGGIVTTRISLSLIDYSLPKYYLIAIAQITPNDWKKNELVWRASFKSLKIDPDAAKRALEKIPSSNKE